MNSCRTLAAVLYVGGSASFLLALEQQGQALNCQQVEYGSALCTPAFSSEPVEIQSGTYCVMDAGNCVKGSGSLCVDRWGAVYSGDCVLQSLTTNPTYFCYEDAYQTYVNCYWFTASCTAASGQCKCHWEPTATYTVTAMCDCYDVLNN